MLRGMQWSGWRAVLAVSTALVLAGCAQTGAPVVTSSGTLVTPSLTPGSQALAVAAEKQYLRYFQVSGDVLRDGGRRPERLRAFLTADEYKTESADLAALRTAGRHLVGQTTTRNFTVQGQDPAAQTLTAYVCVDNGTSRIANRGGKDVTPSQRAARTTLLLTFSTSSNPPLLAKSVAWAGSSVC